MKTEDKIIEILKQQKLDLSQLRYWWDEEDMLKLADQILKLFSSQKQEMVEEIENIRAKAHNGKDVYMDLIHLKQKLTK